MNFCDSIYFQTDNFESILRFRTFIDKQENILIKRDGLYQFANSGTILVGDIVIQKNASHTFDEVEITEITPVNEERVVYTFDCEPTDTLIAANIVVHNAKAF